LNGTDVDFGNTVSTADCDEDASSVATVIFTVWVVVTGTVGIVKVAVVAPEATVTEVGNPANAGRLEILSCVPPAVAGALIVTVPVELCPPVTEVGLRTNFATFRGNTVRGNTVSTADCDEEASSVATVIVKVWVVVTGMVGIVKVAVVAPEATVTEAGSPANAGRLEILNCVPPAGAGPPIVTVPVEL
jgi:hypothetical protein